MAIDRRLFLAGTAGLALPVAARASITAPGATPAQTAALAAIAAYLDAHRAHFALPAMGMVVVDGAFTATIHSGTRDYEGKVPLAADDLWQIGSISKSFVALICLQLASERKIDLDADIRSVLPEVLLPAGSPFTIRGLLDHTTGLPDFALVFQPDGSKLWRGFEAGSHWSYSNTAYDMVGKMIERIEGKPLATVIEARVMAPLGMANSRGAIHWRDRARFPASYVTARPDRPVLQRNVLAPAPWVDVSLGAGSVAATLPDMARYLRYLIGVGSDRGAPLLPNAIAHAWLANPVPQDPATPGETYGLGLMHRPDDGALLLHHTGGMVSFSSSFHVDTAAGTGAFASCAIGSTGYRPRLLTRFAANAMRCARQGKPLPKRYDLAMPITKPGDYAGSFRGGDAGLTVAVSNGLVVTSGSVTRPLEAVAPDVLATDHPMLADFALVAVRGDGGVIGFDHGNRRLLRDGVSAPLKPVPARIAARAGRYQSDDPWIGGFTLVARGEQLFIDGVLPLVEIGDDVWRPADPAWSPERLRFAGFVAGQPALAILSGRVLERRDG